MAHREQHSNRETKKPKKPKPRDEAETHHRRSTVHEELELKAGHTRRNG